MSSLKYKNLAELKAAYESGELDPVENPLVLDNDGSWVYIPNEQSRERVKVYAGGGYELREEALTLLGIPWTPC